MAAITVPSEVSLRIFDLPKPKVEKRNSFKLPKSAVEIKGPLGRSLHFFLAASVTEHRTGQMTLNIPSFLTLDHNEAAKKVIFTVEDQTIKHQKAMWGMRINVVVSWQTLIV
jgi:large subunit ribosomal protein L6